MCAGQYISPQLGFVHGNTRCRRSQRWNYCGSGLYQLRGDYVAAELCFRSGWIDSKVVYCAGRQHRQQHDGDNYGYSGRRE